MARDDSPLVFSTDGSHRGICPICGRAPCACAPAGEVVPARTVLRLHLERKGRGGKAVTVVSELPPHPSYFHNLIKQLKAHCGAGGALREGWLELQGDQRDKVQAYLQSLGFTVRRAGG
jgi:translation initiation factor 1